LLYLILLAATAAGKQNAHDSIRVLLRAMKLENLIQAGGLASVQGTEDIMRAHPNCLVLIDEFGRWLRACALQGVHEWRDIQARAPEIAVRLATIVAWWRGSEIVEVADWQWGWALAEMSCRLVLKGANEQMKVKREFAKICQHIKSLLAAGPQKIGQIHAHSRSAAGNQGMEIVDKALADLILSEEIHELSSAQQEKLGLAPKGSGRRTRWFELIR
jgi:hypothetical protein